MKQHPAAKWESSAVSAASQHHHAKRVNAFEIILRSFPCTTTCHPYTILLYAKNYRKGFYFYFDQKFRKYIIWCRHFQLVPAWEALHFITGIGKPVQYGNIFFSVLFMEWSFPFISNVPKVCNDVTYSFCRTGSWLQISWTKKFKQTLLSRTFWSNNLNIPPLALPHITTNTASVWH